ncbi:MAG TPA: chemotaxis protein CheW [Gemmatimonadaceae bacterium]|nr:chemotaxis protein CheW [Gemmatimonadaceae bacterium]
MTSAARGPAERTQLVTFRVGDDRFAADIFSVERVLRFTASRQIPNVPAWLEGVIDYGGRVVPVVDLRARFELPAAASRETARILIVVVAENDWIAVIVDGVDDVTTVSADQLEPPPPIFRGLAKQYLRALVRPSREAESVMVVLDLTQLLGTRERIVLEQAMAGEPSRV